MTFVFAGAVVLLLVSIVPRHRFSNCSDVEPTQASRDVVGSQDALIDIFERIENFFRQFEEYIDVLTT